MPRRPQPVPKKEFEEFVRIVRRLRRDCPWDRKQTHQSLRPSLIEETYEAIESLDEKNYTELAKELGDLLLHIGMHSIIAEESGQFTLRDVLSEVNAKLIRRHPHVFGAKKVKGAAEVLRNWDKIKMDEGRVSVLEGVPRGMPALQRAQKIQERAAKVGFDWKRRDDVWKKVREELEELRETLDAQNAKRREEEFGDLLFALVNYARFVGVNPEQALRGTTEKFIGRFSYIEKTMKANGEDIHNSTLERMDELWEEAKRVKVRHKGGFHRKSKATR
jgi:tetrapyrrole methylase family protein / MazG family protein